MKIREVLAKAKQEVELIKDGSIFYLVLNQGDVDFTFTDQTTMKIDAALTEVENSTGPAVLVTLSSAKKRFSTGFDLQYFNADKMNKFKAIPAA